MFRTQTSSSFEWFAVLILLLINFVNVSVRCELFSAIVNLEKLLDTDRLLVRSLDAYLSDEEVRLRQLKDIREKLANIESIASQDVNSYVANPINAFLLVKSLTTDWKNAEEMMMKGSTEIANRVIKQYVSNTSENTFPSEGDLGGAVEALIRLQDTYQLETSRLASGQIELPQLDKLDKIKSQKTLELSASDCFQIGRQLYIIGDHQHTIMWMQEALNRYEEEEIKTVDKFDILDHLAYTYYLLSENQPDNLKLALKMTEELLKLKPDHVRAQNNKRQYESELQEIEAMKQEAYDFEEQTEDSSNMPKKSEESEWDIYQSLCRGEVRISPEVASKLSCHFLNTTKIPYLRLMRIKVELAFKKPSIFVFHDVMSDKEIEVIKKLAIPRLHRATVHNPETGKLENAKYRVGKAGWLRDDDHEVVDRLSKRMEAITGLSTSTAEALQVLNYGIGGHYEPHYDYSRDGEINNNIMNEEGNRIATWLNYLSDVEAGGATAFPKLRISVRPKKGSAVFWYNLHRDGEGDKLTKHGACPVLVGAKWVANKWFNERGQEFLRPCGLEPDS